MTTKKKKKTNAAAKQTATSMSNGEFAIVSGLDLPPRRGGRSGSRYPFSDMGVGDAFAIPDGAQKKLATAAYAAGRRLEMKFTVRQAPDGGYFCFRLE